MSSTNEYLTRKYVDGVYIPSGLLVVGCLIVKRDWFPYAIVLALLLGGYKVWSSRKSTSILMDSSPSGNIPGR